MNGCSNHPVSANNGLWVANGERLPCLGRDSGFNSRPDRQFTKKLRKKHNGCVGVMVAYEPCKL